MTSSLRKRSRRFFLMPASLATFGAIALGSIFFNPELEASQLKFQDCDECPEMIVIPPGSFQMGFDGGEPERYGRAETVNDWLFNAVIGNYGGGR